jgi:hypothetical protein
MHPYARIKAATEVLERTKASLLARQDSLVGYEREYLDILDGLIGMMKSAQNAHWFMSGFSAKSTNEWDTRDRWKRDALALAKQLVKDADDNTGDAEQGS